MTEPSECPACGGQGWLLCNTGNDQSQAYEIQRCDACEKYENDQVALEAVVKAAQARAELLKFVTEVGGLRHESEPDDDPFERTWEDTIVALNEVIMEARQLLGISPKCSECGQTVPFVIGCPDGAEVCQGCFNADQH
jgi:ribosome-binding protein aMBF1 (putative translation factor)